MDQVVPRARGPNGQSDPVGRRIKQVQPRLGLTQIELARLLDVSNVTVNRWANGKAAPAPAMLQRIEALTVSPHSIAKLPTPSTTVVGRAGELAALSGAFAHAPLLTLTGPPGSGKTRLAVEFAARSADRFPGGVWFVDLAPLPTGSGIVDRVAAALGVRAGGAPAIDRLIAARP